MMQSSNPELLCHKQSRLSHLLLLPDFSSFSSLSHPPPPLPFHSLYLSVLCQPLTPPLPTSFVSLPIPLPFSPPFPPPPSRFPSIHLSFLFSFLLVCTSCFLLQSLVSSFPSFPSSSSTSFLVSFFLLFSFLPLFSPPLRLSFPPFLLPF